MAKKTLVAVILLATFQNNTIAQYYYKDIVSNKQVIEERATLTEDKISTVSVKSFETYGEPSEGFFCEKKISKDFRKIETYTKSALTGKSILTSYFNEKGLIIKSTDSSETNASTTIYQYDNNNNLAKIISDSHSSDDDFTTYLKEVRIYSYNEMGLPVKMDRIRNNKDTTIFNFSIDEDGNVEEEDEVAVYGKHYYYYYDDEHRLTDIVRYNARQKKALADFLFEYNEAGQLGQMMVTEESINNPYSTDNGYLIWVYLYDGKLRVKEKCFSKEKKLLGYFEYEYKQK